MAAPKIAVHIERATKRALQNFVQHKNTGWSWEENFKLEMLLSVIIDEAAAFGGMMGTNDVLSAIESHLKNLASHVRLIIAGTGMDSYTADLSSGTDVLKYRMQPWDQQHFWQAVLKKKNKGGKLVAAISESPILRKLITNARCAMYTAQALLEMNYGH